MRRKTYFYYTILANDNFANDIEYKPLPTYPYAMRFGTYADMVSYANAKRDFVQSTKIPDSCDKCPLACEMCDLTICYGSNQCRRVWRKIWGYVK